VNEKVTVEFDREELQALARMLWREHFNYEEAGQRAGGAYAAILKHVDIERVANGD
jgi:hypothetical protein